MTTNVWSIERIRKLSKVEIKNLRENAHSRGHAVIVSMCDAVLAEVTTRSKLRKSKHQSRSTFSIPDTASTEIADLLLNLPKTSDVMNAQNRLEWLANPVTTFTGLWRHYITCAFSSQMKSDPDTPLGRFTNGKSPLLNLQSVFDKGSNPSWFEEELRAAGLNRMHKKN